MLNNNIQQIALLLYTTMIVFLQIQINRTTATTKNEYNECETKVLELLIVSLFTNLDILEINSQLIYELV